MSVFVRQPRWLLFHAICLTGILVMVNLSFWQFGRLDERQQFNALVRARTVQTVVPIEDLDLNAPADIVWRRAGAVGTYAPQDQVLILNRSQGGRAGVNVVTPLLLADGRSIMVVRGFIPLNQSIPEPPPGEVRVVGTIRVSEERRTGQPTEMTGELRELFRLDLDRLAAQIDTPLVPVALTLEISDPAENRELQPVAKPELSAGSHFSYGIQWLIFAIAVLIGWVLALRRSFINQSRAKPSGETVPQHPDLRESDQEFDTPSPRSH